LPRAERQHDVVGLGSADLPGNPYKGALRAPVIDGLKMSVTVT
jgi:hypothetical protein